jgi:hypothetical protein
MLFSQLVREANLNNTENLIICDSGIIESIAHSLVFEINPHFELIENLSHKKYDIVFICDPATVPLEDNNVRETDPILRTKLDQATINVAIRLGYNPITLTGDVEKRTGAVIEILKSTYRY